LHRSSHLFGLRGGGVADWLFFFGVRLIPMNLAIGESIGNLCKRILTAARLRAGSCIPNQRFDPGTEIVPASDNKEYR
jgi:hypothetical protein